MNHKTTRTWAVMMAAVLALSLLLTACGTSGITPTGDNSTPGVTETPGATDPTPDDTTEPSNTPSEPDSTSGKTYDKPVILLPDPEDISEEYLEHIYGGYTIDSLGGVEAVDNYLDEIYDEYSKYLNENISKNCVKIGIFSILSFNEGAGEITTEALEKVNELLKSNGEEPLDNTKEPKQKITAFWLAASLSYDPNYNGDEFQQMSPGWRFDIAHAFALAKYSKPDDVRAYEDIYASDYAQLFKIWEPNY